MYLFGNTWVFTKFSKHANFPLMEVGFARLNLVLKTSWTLKLSRRV